MTLRITRMRSVRRFLLALLPPRKLTLPRGPDRDDLALMLDQDDWPLDHYLPIKHVEGHDFGVLVRGQGPVVYSWDLTTERRFDSFEAIVDSGWVVD